MIEVLRTNDPVRLDYAMILLREAGCYPYVADRFMAAAEGGISAFERRILVPDEHADQAKEALKLLDGHTPPTDDPPEGES
jgi:hypothetical protein